MATNVTGLPSTGYTNTAVARITKTALQRAKNDPILVKFLKNDASFNRDLDKDFTRGDIANVQVAPKLTGYNSTNIADVVQYQTATFDNVPVTLSNIAYVPFEYRDVNQAISDIELRNTLAESAGITLSETMYGDVLSKLVNNTYIATDQRIGTLNTAMNFNALRRLRTTAELQFRVKRTDKINVILNPYQYEELQKDSAFQYQISGDTNTIMGGMFNSVLNMEIYSDAMASNNGGGSQSISGSAGFVGVAFVDDAGVLVTRQLTLSDPSRQYRASVDGISALYTSTYDASKVGGLTVQDKMEVLYGFQTLPVKRFNSSNTNAKVWPILGGL